MGLFSKILEKLGLGKKDEQASKTASASKPSVPATKHVPAGQKAGASVQATRPAGSMGARTATAKAVPERTIQGDSEAPASAPVQPAVTPISEVDVVKQLGERAEGSGLDWKVSIVDLLKLLDIDSSREARKELAQELGCPPELMEDSAQMNTWLHKAVLRKIAENGGNIPASLLD